MDLSPILARLQAGSTGIVAFGRAADFTSASQNLRQKTPAAFLLNLAERAGQNQYIGVVGQLLTARFGVVLAIQNLRDPQGEAAQDDLEPIRIAVRSALLGWTPDSADSPCVCSGGRLLALHANVLWWQDDFETTYYVRSL